MYDIMHQIKTKKIKNDLFFFLKNKEIASIKNNNIFFNNENLNSIRSIHIRKKLIEYLNAELNNTIINKYNINTEDPNCNAINALLHTSLKDINNLNNNDLEIINSLLFSYSNLWYESRVSLNLYWIDLFENNSDLENDIITALMIKSSLSVLLDFIKNTDSIILTVN